MITIPHSLVLRSLPTIANAIFSMHSFMRNVSIQTELASVIPFHLIVGQRGVGKSLALNYVIFDCMHSPDTVIISSSNGISNQFWRELKHIDDKTDSVILYVDDLPNFLKFSDCQGWHIRELAKILWGRNIKFSILASSLPRFFSSDYEIPNMGSPTHFHVLEPLSRKQFHTEYQRLLWHWGAHTSWSQVPPLDVYANTRGRLSRIGHLLRGRAYHEIAEIPYYLRKGLKEISYRPMLLRDMITHFVDSMKDIDDCQMNKHNTETNVISCIENWMMYSDVFQHIYINEQSKLVSKVKLSRDEVMRALNK